MFYVANLEEILIRELSAAEIIYTKETIASVELNKKQIN